MPTPLPVAPACGFGRIALIASFLLGIHAMSDPQPDAAAQDPHSAPASAEPGKKLETATFGEGCFWCTEAVFQRLKGVQSVVSGYSGGQVAHPTYEQVCTGTTGHAESVQITFDPKQISYAELLKVFWKTHDPTTLNRQGNDHGTQYRSVIFYHNDQQRKLAKESKRRLDASGAGRPDRHPDRALQGILLRGKLPPRLFQPPRAAALLHDGNPSQGGEV